MTTRSVGKVHTTTLCRESTSCRYMNGRKEEAMHPNTKSETSNSHWRAQPYLKSSFHKLYTSTMKPQIHMITCNVKHNHNLHWRFYGSTAVSMSDSRLRLREEGPITS